MRHADAPLLSRAGQPLRPLLLVTQHHLFVLLPEAARAPAVEGAAAGGGPPGSHREVALRIRLQLYRDAEELLLPLPPTPAEAEGCGSGGAEVHGSSGGGAVCAHAPPVPADSWGAGALYDGEDAWVLPVGARALATGTHPVDPAALHSMAATVATARHAVRAPADEGLVFEDEQHAAIELVRALALRGWEPQVLLAPSATPGEVGQTSSGVLHALVLASENVSDEATGTQGSQDSNAVEGATAAKAVAALAAAADGLAVGAEALRAALAGGTQAGASANAAGAAGAAARARERQQALRVEHLWQWCEVGPEGHGELPSEIAAAVRQQLRMPRAPMPPEPLADSSVGVGWFYGN